MFCNLYSHSNFVFKETLSVLLLIVILGYYTFYLPPRPFKIISVYLWAFLDLSTCLSMETMTAFNSIVSSTWTGISVHPSFPVAWAPIVGHFTGKTRWTGAVCFQLDMLICTINSPLSWQAIIGRLLTKTYVLGQHWDGLIWLENFTALCHPS